MAAGNRCHLACDELDSGPGSRRFRYPVEVNGGPVVVTAEEEDQLEVEREVEGATSQRRAGSGDSTAPLTDNGGLLPRETTARNVNSVAGRSARSQ